MLRKCLIMILSMITIASLTAAFGCRGSAASVAGTYICSKAGDQFYGSKVGNYYEFKRDGTFYLAEPKGGGAVGQWKVEGNEIILVVQFLGSNLALKGQIRGNTIILDDGSEWVNEQSLIARGTPGAVVKAFYDAYLQGKYEQALSYYGPQWQAIVADAKAWYQKNSPSLDDTSIWHQSLQAPASEFGVNGLPAPGPKSIKITRTEIAPDGQKARVYHIWVYENVPLEASGMAYDLNKVKGAWKIGW